MDDPTSARSNANDIAILTDPGLNIDIPSSPSGQEVLIKSSVESSSLPSIKSSSVPLNFQYLSCAEMTCRAQFAIDLSLFFSVNVPKIDG